MQEVDKNAQCYHFNLTQQNSFYIQKQKLKLGIIKGKIIVIICRWNDHPQRKLKLKRNKAEYKK